LLFALAAMLFAVPAAQAHEIKSGQIVIKHPWCRLVTGWTDAAAGFMKIINRGKEPDRLIAATSELSDRTLIVDASGGGTAQASPVELKEGVPLPPGATVELKPRAISLMFDRIGELPMAGASFPGRLIFEKAGAVDVDFEVVPHSGEPDH
jgi:hypothetical protein